LQNKDNIKNITTLKFKDKLWCDKELEGKIKLRYYEVINANLQDKKYLYVLTSAKKKITISKTRANSYELHCETYHVGSFPKHCGMKESLKFVTLGSFSKHCGMKESLKFVTVRGLKMKIKFF